MAKFGKRGVRRSKAELNEFEWAIQNEDDFFEALNPIVETVETEESSSRLDSSSLFSYEQEYAIVEEEQEEPSIEFLYKKWSKKKVIGDKESSLEESKVNVKKQSECSSLSVSDPKLCAEPNDKVFNGLVGLTMLNPSLELFVPEKIVIRSDHKSMCQKVKLLSGGRAGYDPMFTGFIGYGLLTAAVYGNQKGGPTSKQVLAALRELRNPQGIIILIKNNLDERLNFGLAMERARAEGIFVDMVAIGGDCWEKQENSVGRRCLSGIIPIIKVAGAMSEAGRSMKEIYLMCRGMILASLSVVYLKDSKMRFGTNIDGIGGKCIGKVDVHTLIKKMVHYMVDSKRYLSVSVYPLNKFIVVVNSYFMDSILLGNLAYLLRQELEKVNLCVERIYCSTFISAPRRGFCFTLVKDIEKELLPWFDASVMSKTWPENALSKPLLRKINVVSERKYPPEIICDKPYIKGPHSSVQFSTYCLECISVACKAVMASEITLNKIDPNSGYGTLVASGAKALLKAVEDLQLNVCEPFFLISKIGTILEESIYGAVGVMYNLFFTGIAQSFLSYTEKIEVTIEMWGNAIRKGINLLASMTNIRFDECTLIDALYPFYKGLAKNPHKNSLERFEEGVQDAETGAKATSLMKSSKHLPDSPEPGAQVVATVVRALYETAKRLCTEETQLGNDFKRVECPYGIVQLPPSSTESIQVEEVEEEELGEEDVIFLGYEGEEEMVEHLDEEWFETLFDGNDTVTSSSEVERKR